MKRGFTLAELLGVTVLLALIVAVSYPVILNTFGKKQDELDSYKREMIETAAINYIKSNLNEYPLEEKQNSCIFLKTLVDNNLVGYEVDEKLYNRIVKVNLGINNKYNAEILDENTVCNGIAISDTNNIVTKKYEIKTCEKKDPDPRHILIDHKIQYYEDDILIKQTHKIKGENGSSLSTFQNKADKYSNLVEEPDKSKNSPTLKYTNGITITMDRSESYFEMYVEFDIKKFEGFTTNQKEGLKNANIFYDTINESLDTTCN